MRKLLGIVVLVVLAFGSAAVMSPVPADGGGYPHCKFICDPPWPDGCPAGYYPDHCGCCKRKGPKPFTAPQRDARDVDAAEVDRASDELRESPDVPFR